MRLPYSLAGKTALITGGTRGIGRAISLNFARAGAAVIANYVRDQSSADQLRALAAGEGLQLETCRADISDETGLNQLIDLVNSRAPALSVFVHCAATGIHRPLSSLSLRHFDWTFALNVRSFFALTTRLLQRFSSGSTILAISSEGAARAVTQYTVVGASKGALEAMVRHFAAELAPQGIRVNALAPGSVLTDAWNALPDRESRLEAAARKTPLRRLVTLEEVAMAAQFLCSDASGGIVGQTIIVDGGARIVSS